MISLCFPSIFGEHYKVLAQGQKPISCGVVVDTTDAARFFSILTRELMIPRRKLAGNFNASGCHHSSQFLSHTEYLSGSDKTLSSQEIDTHKNPASGTIAGNRYWRWLGLLFYPWT